jgi:DNA invertase Pin-like site-specific DNA recombinase
VIRRATIYARISRDREGAGLGVERQIEQCRELAERLGWVVVGERTDNDLSAYSGKPRPGYRAMLADVQEGRTDAVIAWHTDRLHRSPVELEEYIGVCSDGGRDVPTHCVKAGPLDLATANGKMQARISGAVARHEVEHMIERQKAAKAQAAASGDYRGGRRPFGYESDGVTVREDEAAIVREATGRVLAGESLHSLARDLNARGVPTSTGAAWKPPALRRVLLRARNAAVVEHAPAPGEPAREVGPATWPAIVDPAEWRNLRRLLTADGRRAPRSADARWLGSGVYLCAVCGDGTTMLSASGRTGNRRTVPSYRCRNGSHITRVAQPLDDYVAALAVERLSRPDARLLLAPAERRADVETLTAQREDLTGRQNELAALFADGAVTGPQLAEGTRKLREQVEHLDAEIASASGVSPLAGFADADDVAAAWAAAPIARRKAIVSALMAVTLFKAGRGRPAGWTPGHSYFNPDTVRIEWRS